jgi:two-component sensor histidine kinase
MQQHVLDADGESVAVANADGEGEHYLDTEQTLRHELNHRVKNNLGIVRSLIWLKQNEVESVADLSDTLHQVEAIRLLHEALQSADDLQTIDIHASLQSILSAVFDSSVYYDVSGVDARVTSTEAMPIGLIINDLATNAVKHGFSGHAEKRFGVDLQPISGTPIGWRSPCGTLEPRFPPSSISMPPNRSACASSPRVSGS